jgi:hypothetical protein
VVYGEARGNASRAVTLYRERFPSPQDPDARLFPSYCSSFVVTGSGTRRLAIQQGLSKSIIWRTLHEQQLHPYDVQHVQTLKPENLPLKEWLDEKYPGKCFGRNGSIPSLVSAFTGC